MGQLYICGHQSFKLSNDSNKIIYSVVYFAVGFCVLSSFVCKSELQVLEDTGMKICTSIIYNTGKAKQNAYPNIFMVILA